jgi:hypothetical protein
VICARHTWGCEHPGGQVCHTVDECKRVCDACFVLCVVCRPTTNKEKLTYCDATVASGNVTAAYKPGELSSQWRQALRCGGR